MLTNHKLSILGLLIVLMPSALNAEEVGYNAEENTVNVVYAQEQPPSEPETFFSGFINILRGDTKISVLFPENASGKPAISVTPTTRIEGDYWIEKNDTSFTIFLQHLQNKIATFDFITRFIPFKDIDQLTFNSISDQEVLNEYEYQGTYSTNVINEDFNPHTLTHHTVPTNPNPTLEPLDIHPTEPNTQIQSQTKPINTYTNPHAVVRTNNGTTYEYDRNGNLTTTHSIYGTQTNHTYNHNNNITKTTTKDNQTITYLYNHHNQRAQKKTPNTTTNYFTSTYQEETTPEGTTTTTYITTPSITLGTIENNTLTNHHYNHLNSLEKVTTNTGTLINTTSHYPYGTLRIEEHTTPQTNIYALHKQDEETGFTYMGARYYSGNIGRFTSQDPVSLALGDWRTVQDKTEGQLNFYLQNPQTHNSYSYAANNPTRYVDKNGEFVWFAIPAAIYIAAEISLTAYDVYDVTKTLTNPNSSNLDKGISIAGAAAGILLPGGGYSGADDVAGLVARGGDEFVQGAVRVSDLGLDQVSTQNVYGTLSRIKNGDTSAFKQDGTVWNNRDGDLPAGNYREYTIETPGLNHRGERRIVHDVDTGDNYYTGDHYETFKKIEED